MSAITAMMAFLYTGAQRGEILGYLRGEVDGHMPLPSFGFRMVWLDLYPYIFHSLLDGWTMAFITCFCIMKINAHNNFSRTMPDALGEDDPAGLEHSSILFQVP
jgi:hypothetical protein